MFEREVRLYRTKNPLLLLSDFKLVKNEPLWREQAPGNIILQTTTSLPLLACLIQQPHSSERLTNLATLREV